MARIRFCLAILVASAGLAKSQEPPRVTHLEARVLEYASGTQGYVARIEILAETTQVYNPKPDPVETSSSFGGPSPYTSSSRETSTVRIEPAAAISLGTGSLSWNSFRDVHTEARSVFIDSVSPPGIGIPFVGREIQGTTTGTETVECSTEATGDPAVIGNTIIEDVELALVTLSDPGGHLVAIYAAELLYTVDGPETITLSIGATQAGLGGCFGSGSFDEEISTSNVVGTLDWTDNKPANVQVTERSNTETTTYPLASDVYTPNPPQPFIHQTVQLRIGPPAPVPSVSLVGAAILSAALIVASLARLWKRG